MSSPPLKGGPLSVFSISGMPCRAKMESSLGMTVVDAVELTISTSGKRLKSSMTTRSSSPVGSGPRKSAYSVFHGTAGSGVDMIGSGVIGVLVVA